MQERFRRYILLLAVVGAGSILVFLDTPLPILISATFLIGFAVMILTGSLQLGTGKRSKKQEGREAKGKTLLPAQEARSGAEKRRSSLLAPLKSAFAAFKAGMVRFRSGEKDTGTHIQKIDELLDQALAENPISSSVLAVPQKPPSSAGDPEVDPFMALSSAQLEDELLSPMEEDGLGDLGKLDVSLQSEEDPLQIEEESDEVNEILKNYEQELSGLEDLGNIDALTQQFEGLEDVDLGGIDLDPELTDNPAPSSTALPEAPAPPEPLSPTQGEKGASAEKPSMSLQMPGKGEDMLAFAAGNTGRDDLLSTLKIDSAQVSRVKDTSLIRDLKDMKVDTRELEKELEDILQKLKPKS